MLESYHSLLESLPPLFAIIIIILTSGIIWLVKKNEKLERAAVKEREDHKDRIEKVNKDLNGYITDNLETMKNLTIINDEVEKNQEKMMVKQDTLEKNQELLKIRIDEFLKNNPNS